LSTAFLSSNLSVPAILTAHASRPNAWHWGRIAWGEQCEKYR